LGLGFRVAKSPPPATGLTLGTGRGAGCGPRSRGAAQPALHACLPPSPPPEASHRVRRGLGFGV